MASVHKHPKSAFWQAAFRSWDGNKFKACSKSTGIPLDQAKKVAQRVADEYETIGKALAPDNARRHDRRFYTQCLDALFEAAGIVPHKLESTWDEYSQVWLREKEREVSPHTYVKYNGECSRFGEFLGARDLDPLDTITHQEAQAFYDSLIASGRSTKTAGNISKTVSSVLDRAALLGFIERNPFKLVKRQRNDHRFERKPFSLDEVKVILEFLKGGNDDWYTACLFGLHFGLRLENATGRMIDDLELVGDRMILRFVPSKKTREIALPIVGELRRHLDTIIPHRDNDLTPSLKGKRRLSHEFNALLDVIGIEIATVEPKGKAGNAMRDKSFHSWRHTNKSLLINAGVEARVADLINAHEDPRVAKGYTHITLETMAKAIEGVL